MLVAGALAVSHASADSSADAQRAGDPTDPRASVPSATYRSGLSDYRAYTEQDVRSWRDVNDEAKRIGGWRAYAREARPDESPGSPAPAPGETREDGHAGHRMK